MLRLDHTAGEVLPAEQRKHNMAHGKGINGPQFDCDHIWTFVFWQHFIDLAKFQVHLPLTTVDAAKYLGQMPLALLARTKDGDDLWKWEIYHERQLRSD